MQILCSAMQWTSIALDARYRTALHNQSYGWEKTEDKTTGRKFDIQTKHAEESQNCKTNSDPQVKPDADSISEDKTNIPNCLNCSSCKTDMSDYFYSCDNKEADKKASEAITKRIHKELNNLFSGIGCFKGIIFLQVKEDICPH